MMAGSEFVGVPLRHALPGRRCTMTSTTGRIAAACKTLDSRPDELARVQELAERQIAAITTPLRAEAVIHGVRVHLTTNSPHVAGLFCENWFAPDDWERATGEPPAPGPVITINALIDVPATEPRAYYSRRRNALWFFNLSFYGQIKSWALGAVARVLSELDEQERVHSIHGACVDIAGRGLLVIAPTGTGKSTSTYGLAQHPGVRLHSDDWVFVRYGPRGSRHDRTARAFISERRFYLRTNLVEGFPESVGAFLGATLENVPPPSDDLLERHGSAGRRVAAQFAAQQDDRATLEPDLWIDVARLAAFDNARAMVSVGDLSPQRSIVTDPREGLEIAAVVLLVRDPASDVVLERLDRDEFLSTLMIGRTPSGAADTAFNAYRLVDDDDERAFIDRNAADPRRLAAAVTGPQAPATLRAEATSFASLHGCAPAFRVNTILAHGGRMALAEAVAQTVDLLDAIARGEAPDALSLRELDATTTVGALQGHT